MLSVDDLCVSYGDFRAVQNVAFSLDAGEVLGLAGANGAGKSSVLRVLAGATSPVGGEVRFDDEVLWGSEADGRFGTREAVKRGIILAPEGRRLFGDLSVDDNLRFGAYIRRSDSTDQDLRNVYELFPPLQPRREQPAATLSGGEQQMVAVGRALMAQPRLLMIDELSLGLAPVIAKSIYSTLARLRENQGLTMVIVDESLSYLSDLASRVVFMGHGQKLAEEDTSKLDATRAAQLYLGES